MAFDDFKTSDFYFELPAHLIAQTPLINRQESKLLVINKDTKEIEHKVFTDIIDYLNKGDCLVLNNTKVIPARLIGKKSGTDSEIEVLLLKRIEGGSWEAIVRPGKKLRIGAICEFGNGILKGEITDVLEDGNRIIHFEYSGQFQNALDELGEMPLPPYITEKLTDKSRYQTVYAKYEGSAAAPTAGLHFTEELLDKIKQKGVSIATVTLNVGLGTFRPVKVDNISEHKMHSEFCFVEPEQAEIINNTKKNGKRVIAVGTTSCRTLESCTENGILKSGEKDTDIFIFPGYKFKMIDGLITNFHLPESTLIMLVSALAGKDITFEAYKKAVESEYRFFSFGDCMLIH